MSNFKYHYNLCECGRPKKDTSRRCAFCATAASGDTCPGCGGTKSKAAKLCRSCRFPRPDASELDHRPWYGVAPDYSQVPEGFFRALAGFLMGEGCIALGATPNWSPRVDIGVHSDDRKVLEITQEYLGGSIHNHSGRPLSSWRLQGLLPVRELLLRVKEYAAPLQAIKMHDLDLTLGYIDWRLSRPHHLGEEDKADQLEWDRKLKATKVRSSL